MSVMSRSKRFLPSLLLFALFVLSVPAPVALADHFTGEKTLGLAAGYSGYNRSAVTGVEFTYRFCRNLRVAPSMDYVFRHRGTDAMQLNLDLQTPLPVARGVALYPLVGLNYSSYNRHSRAADPSLDDVTTRQSRFGLNLGGGLDLDVTRSLRLGLSAHYTLIHRFHGATLLARIAYRF